MSWCDNLGTFQVNPVSLLNRDKALRLLNLTLDYCREPRDFLKLATPLRFPKGSPMLQSLVATLSFCFPGNGRPREPSGNPCRNYDFVMDTIKQHINDSGLRSAFCEPTAFSPIPYFAWSTPLQSGTAYLMGGKTVGL